WATDNSGNTVMDTGGWMNCEYGDPDLTFHSRDISANPYYLHAKAKGSTKKKQKIEDHFII
ncbi:17409_t:CDS:1, partial [Rhizophagus irregularis]